MHRFLLHIADAAIPLAGPHDYPNVVLWRVTGIRGIRYPTKMAAEVAARLAYPEEGPDQRYARVFFESFVPQD